MEGKWTTNTVTITYDPTKIPRKITVVDNFKFVESVSLKEMTEMCLKAQGTANEKFKKVSCYMFIFGKELHFELGVNDMDNANENSGIIFRVL